MSVSSTTLRGRHPARLLVAGVAVAGLVWASPQAFASDIPHKSGDVQSGPPLRVEQALSGSYRGPQQPAPARPTMSEADIAAARARAADDGAKPKGPAAASAPATLAQSFFGSSQTQSLRPPDTHGAVGRTQFLEVTNSKIQVFNKADGVSTFSSSLNSFFGYTAAGSTTIFDPRAVYDPIWDRWVVVAEGFAEANGSQKLFVAASTSGDAKGGYCLYSFEAPRPLQSDFYDYPQLGYDQDALYVTANIFAASYKESNVFSMAKSSLYNCRGFGGPVFAATTGTLAPPIVQDSNSNAYFLSAQPGTSNVKLHRYTNGGRTNQSFTFQADVPVGTYNVPPAARQVGTTDRLDSLEGRFQNNSTQLGDALLNAHTVALGSFPAGRYYSIDTEGAAANTVPAGRSGNIYESGSSDDFQVAVTGSGIGGTATNPIGRIYATWTSTDVTHGTLKSRHQSRMRAGGKFTTDAGVLTGTALATSSVAYNPSGDTTERWGDYAAVTIDPIGDGACPVGSRAWAVGEYNAGSSTLWRSRIGRVGYC